MGFSYAVPLSKLENYTHQPAPHTHTQGGINKGQMIWETEWLWNSVTSYPLHALLYSAALNQNTSKYSQPSVSSRSA